MEVFQETMLISTGFVGIISNIITLLVILTSRRTTATYLYIIYVALLMIVEQCVSPTFHHLHALAFDVEYDERQILIMILFIIICGKLIMMNLLFLMDYFRWISKHKWIILTLHFGLMALFAFLYLAFELKFYFHHFLVLAGLLFVAGCTILQLLQEELEMLTRRKQDDDESRLRKVLLLTFFCGIFACVLVFAIEQCVGLFLEGWRYTRLCIGLYQIHPTFLLIALFKCDDLFKRDFKELFNMCVKPWRSGPQFQTLSSNDMLRQDV